MFDTDLDETDVAMLLDRYCSKAQRSSLKPFVTLASTIRKQQTGNLATVRLGINNTHHEGLNRHVHLIINQAYGFHSASVTLAQNMVIYGPINHVLPHKQGPHPKRRPTFMPGGRERKRSPGRVPVTVLSGVSTSTKGLASCVACAVHGFAPSLSLGAACTGVVAVRPGGWLRRRSS